MADPYVWIDPFEEIDRANRRAAQAYSAGQRSILRQIEGRYQQRFEEVLDLAVHALAEEVAQREVAPHMASTYEDFTAREATAAREARKRERAMSALVGAMKTHGALSLDVAPNDQTFVMRYEVLRPFRYNVNMSPLSWV